MKRNHLVLTLLCLFCARFVLAQDDNAWENYVKTINNTFSEVPEKLVPTGLLIEKAIPFVNLNEFSGEENSSVADYNTWKKIHKQFCMSHLDYSHVSLDQTELKNAYNEGDAAISCGLIAFKYNQFSENAIQNKYIWLDSVQGKIHCNEQKVPFDEKLCFAIAPLTESVVAGMYTIAFSADYVMGNIQSIDNLWVDVADGMGLQPIEIGQSVAIDLTENGLHIIKLQATINGKECVAYGTIMVNDGVEANNFLKSYSFGIEPDFGPTEYYSDGLKAEYAVYLRCNGDGTIRKPYIIVSGFDPMDKNRLVDNDEKVNLYRISNKNHYLDNLRNEGYDIIIYRSKESTRSIIDNGLNLVSFIQKINEEKTSDNELIIAGASMGGLVVRYALTYMEYYNLNHETKLFVSVDSPQEGANVPLGIQYMVRYLNDDLFESIDGLEKAESDMLNSEAAKEMILYHHLSTSGKTAKCDAMRTEFLNEMQKIGNFPKQCRTIGLSMGSGTGTSQGFSAGALLLKKEPSISYLVPSGTLIPRLTWSFSVNAVPNQTSKTIYTESIKLQSCLRVLSKTICTSGAKLTSRNVSVNNTAPIDNAPGSIQNLHNTGSFRGQGSFLGLDYLDIVEALGDISYDKNPDNFIPSYSSLGLQNVQNNPSLHIKNYLKSKSGIIKVSDNQYINTVGDSFSLFDVLYVENKNLDHIYDDTKTGVFTDGMTSFMSEETAPTTIYVENKIVDDSETVAEEAREMVLIGSDVDEYDYNNGSVTIEDGGKMSVVAGKKIVIDNGTSVKAGGQFSASISSDGFCDETDASYVKSFEMTSNAEDDIDIQLSEGNELVSVIASYSEPVILYPNPVESVLTISSNKTDNVVRIFSATGKKMLQQKFYKNVELDMSSFSEGTYLVEVTQGNGNIVTKQIIKQ